MHPPSKVLLSALFAAQSFCAITNPRTTGVTNTQAVIAYTAPSASACTLEVSESASYVPLVHDIDPALFAGSNSDNRAGNVSAGRARVVVIGKRATERASDGIPYSRALQAYTTHYFRITCGADVRTSTFRTANISLGSTYGDALPVDPDFPGHVLWPHFDLSTVRSQLPGKVSAETAVDPFTGMLIRRLTLSKDALSSPPGWRANLKKNYTAAAAGSGWTSPELAIDGTVNSSGADTGNASTFATFDAATPTWLALTPPRFMDTGATYLAVSVPVTVDCGAGCPGAALQVCWSKDGTSPTPICDTRVVEQPVTATKTTYDLGAGDTAAPLHFWTPSGQYYPLKSADIYPSATLGNAKFRVLMRRKDGGVLRVYDAGWTLRNYATATLMPESGSFWMCSPVEVSGGYYCLVGNSNQRYWISKTTGEARYLGGIAVPSVAGADGWNRTACYAKDAPFDSADPRTTYCLLAGTSGKRKLVRVTYTGDNSSVSEGVDQQSSYAVVVDDLEAAMLAFEPTFTWHGFAPLIGFFGMKDGYALMTIDRGEATLGWRFLFNVNTGAAVAASNTYSKYPLRWGVRHSDSLDYPPGWMVVSTNALTSSSSLHPASGPWLVTSTDASVPQTGGACPPASANIANLPNWPATNCSTINVDGEPCDPDIGTYSTGSVRISSGVATATGTSTNWVPEWTGGTMVIDGVSYTWTYGSGTTGRLSPVPSETFSGSYTLYKDPITCQTPGKTSWSYLQDAAPGDMFCLQPSTTPVNRVCTFNGTSTTTKAYEYVRLLTKTALGGGQVRYVVERKFGDSIAAPGSYGPGTKLVAETGNTTFRNLPDTSYFFAGGTGAFWNYATDPHMDNTTRDKVLLDYLRWGGHGGYRLGTQFSGAATFGGVEKYEVARGTIQQVTTQRGQYNQDHFGTFAGYASVPNISRIQTHPSLAQAAARGNEKLWLLDGRPYARPDSAATGTWTQVTGALYRLTGYDAQYKKVPLTGFCGAAFDPLSEITGPSTGDTITEQASDAYKMCYAANANECRTGSAAGDIYANCPSVGTGGTLKNCNGRLCALNTDAYAASIIQVGFARPTSGGKLTRVLTRGLYRIGAFYSSGGTLNYDDNYWSTGNYWNARALPDASWMIFHAPRLDDVRSEIMLGKLPPFPAEDSVNRGTFIPFSVQLNAGPAGTDNAVVDFGYDPAFRCTARNEACVATGTGPVNEAMPFYFSGETYSGQPCASGCTVTVPALPQRVLYYRVRYRGPASNPVAAGSTEVVVSERPGSE